MEPAISELAAKMHCTEKEVEAALYATQGEKAGAVRLLRRSIFSIKGKFQSDLRKVYGAIILFIDAEAETLLRSHVVLTRESWLYNIDLTQEVMGLEDYIYNAEFRINTIPSLIKDVNEHFRDKLRFEKLKSIIAEVVSGNLTNTTTLLRQLIASQVADREIDIVLQAEKLNRVRFEKLQKSMPTEKKTGGAPAAAGDADGATDGTATAPAEEEKESILILKTDIILAALHGKPISELTIGEKIYVKIIDNSPQGRYIANLLKGEAARPEPVLVPIEEITRTDSGRCSIITKFGPGVFGRVVVNSELKIKVEDSEASGEFARSETPQDSTLPIIIGGGILLVVILLIIFFIFFQ